MINRQLRSDLLAKIKVSQPALSRRAKRLKETYGPMTTDEAVYVIAHMEGLDVSKYLPLAAVDRVRSLVPRSEPVRPVERSSTTSKKKLKPPTSKPYPLLSTAISSQAYTLGTDVFPIMFQLENSIRLLIEKVLSKSGADWWVTRVHPDVQGNVQRTINREKRYPYRDRRGNHPLYYANFDDLKKIIIDPSNKPDFQLIIMDFDWFKVKMDEVYMARNNLAHCVPLPKDDIARILLFHRDWARLLDTAGIK
jgi:hypothetical protein